THKTDAACAGVTAVTGPYSGYRGTHDITRRTGGGDRFAGQLARGEIAWGQSTFPIPGVPHVPWKERQKPASVQQLHQPHARPTGTYQRPAPSSAGLPRAGRRAGDGDHG